MNGVLSCLRIWHSVLTRSYATWMDKAGLIFAVYNPTMLQRVRVHTLQCLFSFMDTANVVSLLSSRLCITWSTKREITELCSTLWKVWVLGSSEIGEPWRFYIQATTTEPMPKHGECFCLVRRLCVGS
jgi:hypothetical protein